MQDDELAIPPEAWELGPGETTAPFGPGQRQSSVAREPQRDDDATADTFTADTLDGRQAPPRLWHVPGIIPGRTVTLLSGDGGVGKSTLALQLAVATVAEKPWIGQDPCAGRVLYLSAEDDADELHRRLDAITGHYQIGFQTLEGLRIWPLADQDALLATGAPGKPLEPTNLWRDVGAVAQSWRPALVVLDSSADVFGGSENERAHVRRFVSLLRHLALSVDAAVLLLAHPSLTGMSTGTGLSGSTAWNNSVRSRLYFSAPRDEDGSTAAVDIRTLALRKANYGPSGIEYRLRYSAGAFVNEDIGSSPAIDRHIAADRIDQQFLNLLDALTAQGRAVSHKKGPSYAPAIFAKEIAAKGTSSGGFAAAMSRLFHAGSIRIASKGPPSRQISFIERAPE